MNLFEIAGSCVQGVLTIIGILLFVYLIKQGAYLLFKKRANILSCIITRWKTILILIFISCAAIFVCEYLIKLLIPESALASFNSVGQFVLISVIGGTVTIFSCWACLEIGRVMRLWLHRKVARLSYGFAVLSCCVVIAAPLALSVPILSLIENNDSIAKKHTQNNASVSTEQKNEETLVDKAVNGYFYAINQSLGEKTLQLGENTIGLFFGLIGYLIFSGFTVSMFVNMVGSKQARIAQGEEHYSNLKHHYVVIGSGWLLEMVVRSIVNDTNTQQRKPIVILASEQIPQLRKRLSARLPEECMDRIVFIHGDRTNEEDLRQLCVDTCENIHLIGDFDATDQDDRNLASLSIIDKIHPCSTEKKKCKLYLERYHVYTLFRGLIMNSNLNNLAVEPICFYKQWAEIVLGLRKHSDGIRYPFFDGYGIKAQDEKSFVHVVIIGMSRMGMTLATESAMHLHFPNAPKRRTRITMIDVNAHQEMLSYINLHESVFKNAYHTFTKYEDAHLCHGEKTIIETNKDTAWLDTEFHFIQGNAESKSVRDSLVEYSKEEGVKLVIAVCLPDDRHALSLTLALPDEILREDAAAIMQTSKTTQRHLPLVLVQQKRGAGLMTLLRKQQQFKNVYPFGMMDETIGTESEFDRLVMYMDMTYNKDIWSLDKLKELFTNKEQILEKTKKWKQEPEWRIISNRYAIASRELKLRSFNKCITCWNYILHQGVSTIMEPVAEVEHNRWCMEKLMLGYHSLNDKDREDLDKLGIATKEWNTKANALKNNFIHPALRPWEHITKFYKEQYYIPTINTCIGICLMPDLEKLAKKAMTETTK